MRRFVILLAHPAPFHRPAALADRPGLGPGHAPDRHDRQRHPLHGRPDRQRLRRVPVRRLPDLRAPDRVGSHPRRSPGPAGARARRVVGGAQGRADEVGVQAAPRRDVPRRQPIQRGRGGLLVRVDQEEGRAALRPVRLGPGQLPARLAHRDQQDRRLHGGVRDQQAHQLRALPDLLHAHRVADAVAEGQGLAQVRRAALRHRPLPGDQVRAARAARAGREQELLGRQAAAQDRQARAAAAAGADHAAGRAPQRAGGLDRGARRRTRSRSSRAPASRSRSTAIRTTGRTPCGWTRSPGATSSSARRPTTRSIGSASARAC